MAERREQLPRSTCEEEKERKRSGAVAEVSRRGGTEVEDGRCLVERGQKEKERATGKLRRGGRQVDEARRPAMAEENSFDEAGKETVPREADVERRELVVYVEIEGEDKVTMMELLRAVELTCGRVVGCRAKVGRRWELTMNNPRGKERLLDGFKIKKSKVMATELLRDTRVVSFLNLPLYITDEQIKERLCQWGVEPASEIRRRKWTGTEIYDGTRFLKVRFPDNVSSLPYSTRFETLEGLEYFRVLHDQQVRVCRVCLQPGHILRECPEFNCFKCKKQGHYARECMSTEDEDAYDEDVDEEEEERKAGEGKVVEVRDEDKEVGKGEADEGVTRKGEKAVLPRDECDAGGKEEAAMRDVFMVRRESGRGRGEEEKRGRSRSNLRRNEEEEITESDVKTLSRKEERGRNSGRGKRK